MKLIWQPLEKENPHELGRQLLQALYFRETGKPLPEIALTPQGKPYFPGELYHFSISHTAKHVFCCLSQKPVGLDAEELDRQISPLLAEKILSPAEKERFRAQPDQNTALLRFWVLKEAYAKLTGRGWGNYLYGTDFQPDDPRISIIDGCLVAVLEGE